MVLTRVVACVIALVCACCISASTAFRSSWSGDSWTPVTQQLVRSVVKDTGVQEHQKSYVPEQNRKTRNEKSEMSLNPRVSPTQVGLLEPNGKRFQEFDWQGDEAWQDSSMTQPQRSPPARAIWVTRFPDRRNPKFLQLVAINNQRPQYQMGQISQISEPPTVQARITRPKIRTPITVAPVYEISTGPMANDELPTTASPNAEFPTTEFLTSESPANIPTSKLPNAQFTTSAMSTNELLTREAPNAEIPTTASPTEDLLTTQTPNVEIPTSATLNAELLTSKPLTTGFPLRELQATSQIKTTTVSLQRRQRLSTTLSPQLSGNPQASGQAPQAPAVSEGNDPFVVGERVAPQSVLAHCGESLLHLQVKMDLFGTGQLISPSNLELGFCSPTRVNSSSNMVVFETELHKCGSSVQVTDNLLVYKFTLFYSAMATGDSPIERTNNVLVNISCQYERFNNVSSNGLTPSWRTYHHSRAREATLDFSLKLMNDDWLSERASRMYFLGDVMNIEASVKQSHHAPLHVFLSECVASPKPGNKSDPFYFIIEKHGCLSDSKLANSRSRFMPTAQNETLRFQLETFMFAGASPSSLYITCTLAAVLDSHVMGSKYKACHFSKNNDRWVSASGNDKVCSCCDEETCPQRMARSIHGFKKRTVVLGPISVQKRSPKRID